MKKQPDIQPEAMVEGAMPADTGGVPVDEMAATPQQTEQATPNPFAERLKKAYPDREFASDDEINQAILDRYDELEGYQGQTQSIHDKLAQVLDAEPAIAGIIRDVSKGASFAEALSRNVDMDDITPIEGDPDYEAWSKNLESRQNSKAEKEARMKEMQDNLEFSASEIRAFAEENGMTGEDATKFLGTVDELVGEIVAGKLTKKTLAKLKKAIDYDMDVADAAAMGEVKGRNAKIEAVKADTQKPKGDGMPALSSGTAKTKTQQTKDEFSELIDAEKKRHNKFK